MTKKQIEIKVCTDPACVEKGADLIYENFKTGLENNSENNLNKKIKLSCTNCVGACGLAPVILINDEVKGKVKSKNIKNIIEQNMLK